MLIYIYSKIVFICKVFWIGGYSASFWRCCCSFLFSYPMVVSSRFSDLQQRRMIWGYVCVCRNLSLCTPSWMISVTFCDVWIVVVPGDILVPDCSWIFIWYLLFCRLSSLLSLASVMTLGNGWCGHVFLVGRLSCRPYSGYVLGYPVDILVILGVLSCGNPVLIELVLAQ